LVLNPPLKPIEMHLNPLEKPLKPVPDASYGEVANRLFPCGVALRGASRSWYPNSWMVYNGKSDVLFPLVG